MSDIEVSLPKRHKRHRRKRKKGKGATNPPAKLDHKTALASLRKRASVISKSRNNPV